MNISPQDKAFLITFGSACILVLVFFFTTINPFDKQLAAEEFMDIPIIEEPEQLEELLKEELATENEPISHQLKNESQLQEEAEKFFSQEDQVREALAQQETNTEEQADTGEENTDYQDKLTALLAKAEAAKNNKPKNEKKVAAPKPSSTSRRTTISYILNSRNAVKIPNPVYTCDAVGKVVINVQVNGNGSVTRTSFNSAASTTSNGCLVDQALDYASRAIFTDATRNAQLGSITFEFQG
ncbi:MAG: hypothetical protein WA951_11710 [Leeuwenhoekiella sp.]